MHADDQPATSDSLQVERLRAAGCVVIGKTNTAEYGWKADTTNQLFGPTRNPWDLRRSPGGSSGGSAAAVAAGLVPLATGSDGGGSIRIPAALCGLTGFKPSHGRVPIGGREPPGWGQLTSPGPMARRARDLVLALDAIIGPDPSDLASLPMPESSWSRSVERVNPPRRVAWSPTLGYAAVDSEVLEVCEQAVGRLEKMGTEVELVETVFADDPVRQWLTITTVRDLSRLERLDDPSVWEQIDPGWLAGIEWARSSVSAIDLARAEDACHRLNQELVDLFHRVSHLLVPTVAGQAPEVGGLGTINGEPDVNWVGLTYPFNLTRSPAGTVCAGFTSDGLPVGLQVVGPQHADVAVLRLLALLEDTLAIDATPDLRLLP